jgi:hypothetical protein
MQTKLLLKLLLLMLVLFFCLPTSSSGQTRDYLTPAEIDLVKEAQALDKRTDVFIKAIQRRMSVLTGAPVITPVSNSKQAKKDAELWGETPSGSRAELLGDIAKILDAGIDNIDDVSFHDEKSPLLSKSLRKLAAAATQLISQLEPMKSQVKSEAEFANLSQALENAESIIVAAKKLPPPTETDKNEKEKEKKPKEKPSGE